MSSFMMKCRHRNHHFHFSIHPCRANPPLSEPTLWVLVVPSYEDAVPTKGTDRGQEPSSVTAIESEGNKDSSKGDPEMLYHASSSF